MKIVTCSPFGMATQETGLIVLLSNYLRSVGYEVLNFGCDGAFSVCERDAELNWKRDLHSCLACMKEQKSFVNWGQVSVNWISKYLKPTDIEKSKHVVSLLSDSELKDSLFDGFELRELITSCLNARYGSGISSADDERTSMTRSLVISSIRALIAARRFLTQSQPSIALVGGGEDFITKSLLAQSSKLGFRSALFRWNVTNRSVLITRTDKNATLACDLVLGDIVNMRSDVRTWPGDLLEIAHGILDFLEVDRIPQELPIAQ